MAISKNLNFTKRQLRQFARVFREARLSVGMTQLQVARAAFDYHVSHCKVSRVERCAMPKVDAVALELMAGAVGIPRRTLQEIDPKFNSRAVVAREASRRGFWNHTAA